MLVLALLLCAASVGTGATREKTDIEYNWTDLLKESGADLDSVQERLVADAGLQVRPEILEASNVTAEILHWKKKRLPQVLEFPGGIGYIVETVPTTIQKVDFNKGIGFHFFSKYDEEDIEGFKMVDDVKDPAALRTAGWNEELPVKVITHGFMDYIGADSIQSIKNAYLTTGNFNVIGVDWGRAMGRAASGSWYPWARCAVPFVGARLGRFLDSLIEAQLTEPKMLHVVGHGLGAHVAGIAGKSMTVEDPVARITGLDPAGPLFHFTAKDGHIADSDAQVVDVIHTNAGMLGKAEILGDVDFYPNGGTFQKGCHQDASGTCSHRRAVELFVRTILTSESYEGVFCSAVPATRPPKECMRSARENLPEAVMGNKVSFSKSGPYFVNLKWD